MKAGFNLLLWTTHVTEQHYPLFDQLKAAGYDGIEVPVFEGDEKHFREMSKHIRSAGLKTTTVIVLPAEAGSCLSSDAATRQKSLDYLKWAVDCSAAVKAEAMCGPFYHPLGVFTGKGATKAEKANCAAVHKEAAQYAAKARLKLAVEPLNRFECYFLNTAADAAALVKAVDEPNYGFTFDTFHSNVEEKNQARAIRATAVQINHFHVSANDRGTPGADHIDYAAAFKALRESGYDGWLTVEAFGHLLPDLAAATKVWRPLFRKPEDVYNGALKLIREGWKAAKPAAITAARTAPRKSLKRGRR
jgi:D-psicose/D-tagatose/L-ribulose 3-epimerase